MSSFRCSYKQNIHSGTVDPAGKLEVPSDNGSLEPGQNVCRAQQWIVKVAGISKSRRRFNLHGESGHLGHWVLT